MNHSDKRRQARLQGRHNACLPKTNKVFAKERETPRAQSGCQNNRGNAFCNDVVSESVVNHPIGASYDADKNHYISNNGRHMVQQYSINRSRRCSGTNEESYDFNCQSKSELSIDRSTQDRARFGRTQYLAEGDSNVSMESNVSRTEIQRSLSSDCYKVDYGRKKNSCDDNVDVRDNSQRQNIGNRSKFIYEETEQAENIVQKTKGPITLNILGWHEMIQHNPQDKKSFLYFKPDFLGEEERKYYYCHLKNSINWQEKEIIIRGEKYIQPRLVAWYGPLPYSYSNVVLEPNREFPPIILDIKERIEKILKEEERQVTFNSVLLNLYRDGKDSVAWHSDDELSMGIHPTIASISLGETRRFEMKLKQDRKMDGTYQQENEYVIHLTSGSLLLMDGAMQQYWLHRVPKEYHDRDCRINLTFRTVYPIEETKDAQTAKQ